MPEVLPHLICYRCFLDAATVMTTNQPLEAINILCLDTSMEGVLCLLQCKACHHASLDMFRLPCKIWHFEILPFPQLHKWKFMFDQNPGKLWEHSDLLDWGAAKRDVRGGGGGMIEVRVRTWLSES